MIHRCPKDRHSISNRNRSFKVKGFRCNMPLIMIEGQYAVILAQGCLMEDRVRPNRPDYIISFCFKFLDRRSDLINFFPSKQTMLSTMRIQSCDCHCPVRYAQPLQGFQAPFYIILDSFFRNHIQHLSQGYVPGQEKHAHSIRLKHGQRILGAGKGAKNLCMADVVDSACATLPSFASSILFAMYS